MFRNTLKHIQKNFINDKWMTALTSQLVQLMTWKLMVEVFLALNSIHHTDGNIWRAKQSWRHADKSVLTVTLNLDWIWAK